MGRAQIGGLTSAAGKQIQTWPETGRAQRAKQTVKSLIRGQKPMPADRFSWPNALLGEGLLSVWESGKRKDALSAVERYLSLWRRAGFPIRYVDNLMNGTLALRILRSPEAAADPELRRLCGEAIRSCAEWARSAPKTGKGILAYRGQHPEWIFADALGMVCPFTCRYGAQQPDSGRQGGGGQEDALLALGAEQLLQFCENGMDERTGLPYHGYDEKSGTKYGIIGWGRACGWMLKGLSESLPWIPDRSRLLDAFERLTDAVLEWQRPDGGFSWQLQALEGPRDSSADGMIGTALAKGLSEGLYGKERADRVRCALSALAPGAIQWAREGAVRGCSGECRGFSEYPQTYGTYPWGTGSVLQFLATMDGEIEWEE